MGNFVENLSVALHSQSQKYECDITQPSSTIASNDGLFQVNILEPINNELRRPGQPLEKVGKAIHQANNLFDSDIAGI